MIRLLFLLNEGRPKQQNCHVGIDDPKEIKECNAMSFAASEIVQSSMAVGQL